jgi:hypothetical protein
MTPASTKGKAHKIHADSRPSAERLNLAEQLQALADKRADVA